MAFVPDPQQPTHFVPDAPAAPAAPTEDLSKVPGGASGRVLAGLAEAVGRGIVNIPHNAIAAGTDLYRRVSGGDTNAPVTNIPEMQPGQAEQQLASNIAGSAPVKAIVGAAHSADTALNQYPNLQDVIHQTGGVASDVAKLLPVAGVARIGAGALGDALSASATGAGDAAGILGFRAATSTPGRVMAGSSAGPALAAHNATIGDTVVGSEAGIANGVKPSYESLADARTAPIDVFNRAAASLPNGGLDAQAQAALKSAGLPEGGRVSAGSPQAAQQIANLRQQLLSAGPETTGRNWINELRGLRQEGYTNVASDDVSNQQLGSAQLDMARAVEGNVGRNLPANGDVNLQQFLDARKALAKNYTAQSALRGDTFDLRAIGRAQRADPDLLDGNMKTTADFANANPEVSGPTSPLTAPGLAHDLGGVSLAHPATWVQPITGATGRRILTGGPAVVNRANANALFSGRPNFAPRVGPPTPGGLGAEFEPGP